MHAIKASAAASSSPSFREVPRSTHDPDENCRWVAREVDRLNGEASDGLEDPTFVLLFGGRTQVEFRVRVAQSHLRADLTPSHWSHAALVSAFQDPIERSVLLESALEPQHGFGAPTATNAVQQVDLEWYADPGVVPNIAVLRVPVPAERWSGRPSESEESLLAQFMRQRVIVDMPALVLKWLGFVWGVGKAGNPILEGAGLPSSVMIESLVSAAGFDLSPGLDSQTSAPEAFWQAAVWWHPYFEASGPGLLSGSWCVEDTIEFMAPR